jgi:repressor LexA
MAARTTIQPTKKQRELLTFIDAFISEHGYSPSYREVMTGLGYTSVASVALHINSLIKRGHLRKRDRSARSLEVIKDKQGKYTADTSVNAAEEKWLVEKVAAFFTAVEAESLVQQSQLDELYVLVGSLRVLGLEGAAQSFIPRLGELRNRAQ